MKPPAEISRIIVVRRETMEDSLEWNNISTLEEWEKQSRQNGSRKSSSKLRGTTTTDACSTAKKQARERVRTRLDSPTVVPFPTSPLSEQRAREGEGYIHARIYTCIYIFRRAKKFLLSTIVTRHRIRIACVPERRSFARLKWFHARINVQNFYILIFCA